MSIQPSRGRICGVSLAVLVALVLMSICGESTAMDRPAVAWRLFQQVHPCPATGKKTGACPGWIMKYRKPLEKGGDIAPYNLMWVKLAQK